MMAGLLPAIVALSEILTPAPLVRPVMPILCFPLVFQKNPGVDCACTGHTGKTTIIKS